MGASNEHIHAMYIIFFIINGKNLIRLKANKRLNLYYRQIFTQIVEHTDKYKTTTKIQKKNEKQTGE